MHTGEHLIRGFFNVTETPEVQNLVIPGCEEIISVMAKESTILGMMMSKYGMNHPKVRARLMPLMDIVDKFTDSFLESSEVAELCGTRAINDKDVGIADFRRAYRVWQYYQALQQKRMIQIGLAFCETVDVNSI